MDGFADYLTQSMSYWNAPGISVAVVKNDDLIFMDGFGFRDLEEKAPATPETLFAICSCTKAFTSLALGILADEGEIDINRPIVDFLPDFRLYDDYSTRNATARDILCHRTGLARHDAFMLLLSPSRDEIFEKVRYLTPVCGFREAFHYNNLMYAVAGSIIERLSDRSWEEFVEARLFKPLGMQWSGFAGSISVEGNSIASQYVEINGELVEVAFPELGGAGPAGSIFSTAEEMASWLRLHLNGGLFDGSRIVSRAHIDDMRNPSMVIKSDPMSPLYGPAYMYGLGWTTSHYRGKHLVEHGGSINGASALVGFLPSEGIGVVVLTNSFNLLPHVVSRRVYDQLVFGEIVDRNEEYKQLLAGITAGAACGKTAVETESSESTGEKYSVPAGLAGTYAHPAYGEIEIVANGTQLTGTFNNAEFEIELRGDRVFEFKGSALNGYKARFRFTADSSERELTIPLEPTVPDIAFVRR